MKIDNAAMTTTAVVLCERTFALGQNRYRVDGAGNWTALMWGWFPTGNSPRYQWSHIPAERVPPQVRAEAERTP